MVRLLTLMIYLLFPAGLAAAAERIVPARDGALAQAIQMAQAGDILRLLPGLHAGPAILDKPLTLDGQNGAEIRGNGVGSVITVTAADVTVSGLTITGSGASGKDRDAGVSLGQTAERAVVRGNRILGNLVGVDVHGAKNALITGNVIEGRQDFRMNDRGNGVYVWNAPGTKVTGNDIRWGRDGIFVNTSANNEFSNNRFRDLRFAVHYMYSHDSVVSGNRSLGNHLGFAIMNSNNVHISGNLSRRDRDYGIMLNYTNDSRITGNWIEQVEGKCIFVYNAHKNQLQGNRLERCGIGIDFTAGSERNRIGGNAFVENRTQVKYTGTKWLDWSVDGRGNFWSDHAAFDLDGDGIADAGYRPNDVMDLVLWTQPAARALLGSPAVQLIRWSQSVFPALLPGGIVDSAPLMTSVFPELSDWKNIP